MIPSPAMSNAESPQDDSAPSSKSERGSVEAKPADSVEAKPADFVEAKPAKAETAKVEPGRITLDRVTMTPEKNANRNGLIRIGMLVVIAVVMLANAVGWVDPDLWVPFVCIIAVMGIGTRGGPLESLSFVAIEAAVVLVLGVATFSQSRDFVWAASVGVSLVAIGKVAFMEVQRRELAALEKAESARPSGADKGEPDRKKG